MARTSADAAFSARPQARPRSRRRHPPGFAQAFPARGILVIVPYSAGGGSDISARLLARDFEPIFGKPVTVENRAGGGGWIGWGSLARRSPTATPSATSTCRTYSPVTSTSSRAAPQGESRELHATDQPRHRLQHVGGAARQPVQDREGRDRRGEEATGNDHAQGGGYGTDDHVAVLGIGAKNGTSSRWCISAARRKARPRCWAATSRSCLQRQRGRRGREGRPDPSARRDVAEALEVHSQRADVPRAGLQRGVVNVARHRGAGRPAEGRRDRADRRWRRPSPRRSTRPRPRRCRSTRRSSRARTTASSSRTTSRPPRS